MGRHPFQTLLKPYLESIEPHYAKSTLEEKTRKLTMIGKEVIRLREEGILSTQDPRKLNAGDIGELIKIWKERDVDPETQRSYLFRLDGFLKSCGNLVVDQMRKAGKFPRTPEKEIRVLSDAELEKIKAAAEQIPGWQGEVARFIASVYVSTGLRPSELRLSEIDDIVTGN